ncbi:hypothetical protein ACFXGT_20310 [Streptomyces sp. NPDC059352]|uniref:hypothetical protein n=1 Tax=Streptomyces sp. NPDC059352 TaxID=3346810 RepID=UPI00367543AC
MRIDGSRVTVKVSLCPEDEIHSIEVWDSESEKPLWRAGNPKTEASKSGILTLWAPEDYQKPGPETQPNPIPEQLDVTVDIGSGRSVGVVFDTASVMSSKMPVGTFWTADGPKTTAELNAISCGESENPPA